MRKGAIATVVFLILAVVGAIILFGGTKLWAEKAEKGFDKEVCRTSVTMVALSKKASIVGAPWLNLKCPTQKRELDSENREKILETLTEDIKDCWYQYGSGKIDFTSNWDWGNSHDYCFVCSVINFDKKGESINKDELNPYLLKSLEDENFELEWISEDLRIDPIDSVYIVFGIKKDFGERSILEVVKVLFTLGSYKSGHIPFLIVANSKGVEKDKCDGWYKDSKMIIKKR